MTRPSIADGVVLVIAALLVGASATAFWSPGGAAVHADIHAPGQDVQRITLATDRRIDVAGRYGASVIEIRNGQARFIDSPCRQKLCLTSGWLSREGDSAICLPNGVTLQLAGNERYDSINY